MSDDSLCDGNARLFQKEDKELCLLDIGRWEDTSRATRLTIRFLTTTEGVPVYTCCPVRRSKYSSYMALPSRRSTSISISPRRAHVS